MGLGKILGMSLAAMVVAGLVTGGFFAEPAFAAGDKKEKEKDDKKAKGPPAGCKIEPGTFCVYANMTKAQLKGANLKNANLSNANLSGANLTHANLAGATLSNVDFSGANLTTADFTGAKVDGAKWDRATLSGATWLDGKYKCASTSIGKCDKPLQVVIKGCKIEPKTTCTDVDLTGVNLRTADLSGAKLHKVNLKGANFEHANLEGADFTGSNLRNANLKNAAMKGAILKEADFSGAQWFDGNFKCPEGSIGRCVNPNAKAGHK
jgi:uncharacterized protein YjbI with pentapeptide repeats